MPSTLPLCPSGNIAFNKILIKLGLLSHYDKASLIWVLIHTLFVDFQHQVFVDFQTPNHISYSMVCACKMHDEHFATLHRSLNIGF